MHKNYSCCWISGNVAHPLQVSCRYFGTWKWHGGFCRYLENVQKIQYLEKSQYLELSEKYLQFFFLLFYRFWKSPIPGKKANTWNSLKNTCKFFFAFLQVLEKSNTWKKRQYLELSEKYLQDTCKGCATLISGASLKEFNAVISGEIRCLIQAARVWKVSWRMIHESSLPEKFDTFYCNCQSEKMKTIYFVL